MSADRLRRKLLQDLQDHDGILSVKGLEALDELDDIVLLETHRPDAANTQTLLFDTLEDMIWADRVQEVVPALVRAQMWLERGRYVAGYVSYEAAPAFIPVPTREPLDGPTHLLWMGVYSEPLRVPRTGSIIPMPEPSDDLTMGELSPRVVRHQYSEALGRIRSYLENGHTYQVNYTFGMDGRFTGSSVDLYARLRAAQPVPFGAYLRHEETAIVSLSPELFVHIENDTATLKPMKGTVRRGRTTLEDRDMVSWLKASEKDHAENRMIVDLLRNDIGRLAVPGSVRVPAFFSIEKHPTVFQATSTVTARLRKRVNMVDLFQALFPCGSVTGAPKIETMRIINEVEPEPRGVYTGAIGYMGPDGRGTFSVAIRTAVSDEEGGRFRLGIGSGVTIASNEHSEFDECLLKARFVEVEPRSFQLFETILWHPDEGFALVDEHLARLQDSSAFFDRPLNAELFLSALEEENLLLRTSQSRTEPHRVRIAVDAAGGMVTEHAPLDLLPLAVKVGFSKKRISTEDRFQYHKTTWRPLYDTLLGKARARGWFDALVLNERGEVAEGTRSNLVIRRNGTLVTPPLFAGILPGIYRKSLLRRQKDPVTEATLLPGDVMAADEVYVCNALRGLVRVSIVDRHIS